MIGWSVTKVQVQFCNVDAQRHVEVWTAVYCMCGLLFCAVADHKEVLTDIAYKLVGKSLDCRKQDNLLIGQ